MAKQWGWVLGIILCGASWANGQPSAEKAAGEGSETIPAPRQTTTEKTGAPTLISSAPASFSAAEPRDEFRVFGSVDYLLWNFRRSNTPPLLATGDPLASPTAGFPGDPTTTILFAPAGLEPPDVNGLRIRAGVFLDAEHRFSLSGEGVIFEVARNDLLAGANTPGQPFLVRPYSDASANGGAALFPSSTDNGHFGGNDIRAESRLWSWDANLGYHLSRRMAAYAGFRSIALLEQVRYQQNLGTTMPFTFAGGLTFRAVPLDPGQSLQINDDFDASNRFYGPQAALQYRWEFGPLSFDLLGRLAAGVMCSRVNVRGSTRLLNADGSIAGNANGGFLALPSNIGTHTISEFTLVPELDFNVCWDLATWLRVRLGYSVLYISSVQRAGNQIDPLIDPRQAPADPRFDPASSTALPSYNFIDKDFWAHGVNVGVELRY
jgi:hypothetical protein